ncbi:serine/threonine protein kinase [Geodermatophilus telluris]|uniref:non-specific serine/threonine protein kinase n=1 Tax=Geodermatophilus telluris TaxID=1190417 RepID=A0A1G6JAN2_9ACTN|nr:serine/threonine protein kinase [Geodermatophilus telluris]
MPGTTGVRVDARTLGGRYRLDSVLGRGGMGTVYAATDAVLGRRVAVKVLDLTVADTAGTARFRREAQTLAALEHPFVVSVFDFGVDASAAWLVMPLLPGPDLLTLVGRDGPLPVDDVARYGRQVAEALAAAHGAGIVHRDVKPANLALAADGSCLLLDLGIARLTDATSTSLTGTGLVMGSMPFLAPEVIAGAPAGPAADLYGLGATLFTLLTGRPPFDADGAAVLAQHLHAPAPSAASLRPETPAALDRLLARMLDKDPAARPSAAAVAGALAGATAGALPAAAGPGSSATLVLPTVAGPAAGDAPRRRPRRLLAALGGGIAVLAVAGAAVLAGSGEDPATPAAAPTTTTAAPTTAVASTPAPAPAPTSSVVPTTPAPTPTPAPAPAPAADPVPTALAGLRATVDGATTSGALTEQGLRDVDRRVRDIEEAVARGDAEKAGREVGDLEERLDDLQRRDRLTADGAAALAAALDDVRAALGVGGGDD